MSELTCGEARRLAWGGGGADEVVMPVERARAHAHVARCSACQRFAAEMELLRQVASQLRGATDLPAGLGDRVRTGIAAAASRRLRYRRWSVAALGLAASLALVVWAAQLTRPGSAGAVRQVVSREREFLAQPGIESSDPATVQAWLTSLLTFPLHVPTFTDARLSGAAVAQVNGRPAAVVRFQVGDRPVTYVIVVDDNAPADSAFREARFGNRAAVSWTMPGLVHVWMGSLPATHLSSLARRCAEQALAAARVSVAPRREHHPT
jgi:hypothetical protein